MNFLIIYSLYKFVSNLFFLSFIVLLNSDDIEYWNIIDFSKSWLLSAIDDPVNDSNVLLNSDRLLFANNAWSNRLYFW